MKQFSRNKLNLACISAIAALTLCAPSAFAAEETNKASNEPSTSSQNLLRGKISGKLEKVGFLDQSFAILCHFGGRNKKISILDADFIFAPPPIICSGGKMCTKPEKLGFDQILTISPFLCQDDQISKMDIIDKFGTPHLAFDQI